ncbi:LacI family DNA-binding transcriptional regulator [Herpetosiphon llansteffanensis]
MTIQRQQKVTIKDIAKLCNVSTQTVSRVLNNRPDVSPQTREAVEKAIADMGYQPSALARSLVQQQSFTLGVITAGLQYMGVSLTLNGIAEESEASNYALLLKELPRFDVTNIVPIIEALMARHVDGIIFAAAELNENVEIVQAQLPATCPPIVFVKSQPNERFTTIGIDNYGGARQAVEHLLSIGKREIGIICGPIEWLETRQRRSGWYDGLLAAGITPNQQQIGIGNWSAASGEQACSELFNRYPEINAVFACNDQMALGALHYASKQGLRVPEDLAIVGFDDLAESAYFSPALTTIRQPLRELGRLAVQTLLQLINPSAEQLPAVITTLPTQLIVRESTMR